jgi:periplasmic glucans biosynthesis protein
MSHRHGRRQLLRTAGWLLGSRLGARAASAGGAMAWLLACDRTHAAPGGAQEKPQPFSFEQLIEKARASAQQPYQPPYRPAPEVVSKIDYEVHGKLRFKTARALFGERGPFPVTFFHIGQFFPSSVKVHVVDGGQARELLYSPADFDMPADSIARKLPRDSGFAGFRLHETTKRSDWKTQDWLAFLGASYFRTIGEQGQYGLSARGLAVDTAVPGGPEEFPNFTEFYLESAKDDASAFTIYARLEGPRVSGAYKFSCLRSASVVMDVDAHVFVRGDVGQLGIAPLTSMFWFAEYDRGFRADWRPEVHDSDGLALWNGKGERLFRPLNNPTRVITSSFVDDSPRGFGLVQRDRDFEHYLDGVRYERRPTLWVEPLAPFGKGAVQLIEIPTDDEIHDNIVAFWNPAAPAKAGTSQRFQYRLHWKKDEPFPAPQLSRVVATRIGRGGEPGKPRPSGVTKFVVEFAGEVLDTLPKGTLPKAQIDASRGKVSYVFVERIPDTPRVRAQFDLTLTGTDPSEVRLYLKLGSKPLSETWLYQLEPRKG